MRSWWMVWLSLAAVSCGQHHDGDATDAGCSRDLPAKFPDSGPCDDPEPVTGPFNLTANGRYQITCKPQPLDAVGCKGLPEDTWNHCALRRCAAEASYPVGCNLVTPTSAPHLDGLG